MNAINLFDHIFFKPLWEGFSRLEFNARKVPNVSIWMIPKCTHSYFHTVHKHTHNNTHMHMVHMAHMAPMAYVTNVAHMEYMT